MFIACNQDKSRRLLEATFGMKAFAHAEALVPNSKGRISMSVDPSSMNKALLLPEPWMVTRTFAERTAAMFLQIRMG